MSDPSAPSLRADGLTTPKTSRFDPSDPSYDACLVAHEAAQERGEMGYMDPTTGLFVMTARYHADRGHCCDRGCRHCPYT